MRLTVVGSGDAFGSGGRLQTCFHIARGRSAGGTGRDVLIDCGATALIGMQKLGLEPNDVSHIFVSHLHGDHFSGLVWWFLHAEYVGQRTAPLTIVGPPGLEERLKAASEAMFPSATPRVPKFPVSFEVYDPNSVTHYDDIAVEVCEVRHPCGAPPYALRLSLDGRTVAFSGDTEWVDGLVGIARDADLFICECYAFDKKAPYHLSWNELSARLPELTAKQVMLTHMNTAMLHAGASLDQPGVRLAEDGLVIEV